MKIINSRLGKLEDQLGVGDGKPPLFFVVSSGLLALSTDQYLEIVTECGHLATNPRGSVWLAAIPAGLNAEQTERFLREKGAWLMSPDCMVRYDE